MKNIQNTTEDLELFNSKGITIYKFTSKLDYSYQYTYDANGNQLTYINSDGYSCKYTRDENSDGKRRGFNIPEYTMQQLVEKLGNFKIII